MKTRYTILILLVVLFALIPASSAWARSRSRDKGLNISVYYGSQHDRNYGHRRRPNWDRHKRYGNYRYRPTRYYLPWNKPKVEVSVRYTGSMRYYMPIPPIIIDRVEPKPKVLTQPIDFVSRDQFLIETLRQGTTQERLLAAEELSEHKQITSVAVLIDALFNDSSIEVREAAANSLGEIAMVPAYEPLSRSAKNDINEDVRKASEEAAEIIEENSDERLYFSGKKDHPIHGGQKLAQYLEDLRFGRAEIREQTVKKLRKYESTRAVTALIDTLINDPDKEVREEAAESLAQIGDKMAIPFLKASSINDLEKSVRQEAIDATDQINGNL